MPEVLKMVPDGGGFMSGAIVVGGFASYPLHPFLVLIQEKGAKENQGVRDACHPCRVHVGDCEVVSNGGGFVPRAIVGRQGRGELHSPQHVPTRDGGA